jgi:hypothetical protein
MHHGNDQEFDREVGIMMPQEELAGEMDHVDRFQGDTWLLFSLNHPDIECCIKQLV